MKNKPRIHRKTVTKTQNPQVKTAAEFKIVRLRECPVDSPVIEHPPEVVDFWRKQVVSASWFKEDKECLVVFLLNTRHRLLGFELVSQGTLDMVLTHPRDVFRLASIRNAAAILIAHNHPSGDPQPSQADIKVTRDLDRAARMMKIELLDHVIVGDARLDKPYISLRELEYIFPWDVGSPEITIAAESAPAEKDYSLNDLETAITQTNALLQLLTDNMEFQSRSGCEFSGEQVETFCAGISVLVGNIKDQLASAFDKTFSAIHPKREVAA